MANHHLGRRDVLTLAGLASVSFINAGGAPPPPALARRLRAALGPQALVSEPLAGQTMTTPSKQSVEGRRRELYALLGDLPDRRRAIGGKKRGEEERDGYVLETWDLDLNGIETVPAYLARPRGLTGRAPAVVFDHSHGGGYTIGKKEFTEGRPYLQPVPYAKVLTDLGYVGLAIDHWVFGERSHTTELDMFKAMLWKGQVLWGMMVYDSLRALDWLVTRPDVDSARHRHARDVDGEHHGLVAGGARRAREGHGRHLLPDRLRHAPREEGARAVTASTTTCPPCSSTSRRRRSMPSSRRARISASLVSRTS